jgi:hypothetical protein
LLKIWYDGEGDYLEVMFEEREGFFRATQNDHVMVKVASDGQVLGFSIMRVSAFDRAPLQVAL